MALILKDKRIFCRFDWWTKSCTLQLLSFQQKNKQNDAGFLYMGKLPILISKWFPKYIEIPILIGTPHTHTIYAFMIGGCVSRQGSKTRPFGFLGDTLFQTHLPTCPKSTGVKSTKKNYKHQTWKEYLPVLKVSLFFFGILTEKNPLWVKLKRFLDPSFVAKENTTRNRWEIQRCHTRQTWDGCCWMFLDINHATSPA